MSGIESSKRRFILLNAAFLLAFALFQPARLEGGEKPAAAPPEPTASPMPRPVVPPYSPPEKGFWKTLGDFFLPHYPARKVLLEKETEFHTVTVQDDELGFRHLIFLPDKGSQGTIMPGKPDVVVPNFMKCAFLALPALERVPKRVLFIGLGAGIMPRFLDKHYPELEIEAVEIDPEIPKIAAKFFGFAEGERLKVVVDDGRVFVDHPKKKYDIIFLDAFNARGIPFHLTTVEFYRGVRKSLAPKGVFAANIANLEGRREQFLADEVKTAGSVFKHVAVVECPMKTNWVLFASDEPLFNPEKWRADAKKIDGREEWDFKLDPYFESLFSKEKTNALAKQGKLLTDDFAPVDE